MGLHQRLFDCPESKERMQLLTPVKRFQLSPFSRAEHAFDEVVEISARGPLLNVHS